MRTEQHTLVSADAAKGQHMCGEDRQTPAFAHPPTLPRAAPHRNSTGIVTPKHSCCRSSPAATKQHRERGKKREERKNVRRTMGELCGENLASALRCLTPGLKGMMRIDHVVSFRMGLIPRERCIQEFGRQTCSEMSAARGSHGEWDGG